MKFVYNHQRQTNPLVTVMNIEDNNLFIYDYIGSYKWSEDDTTVTANDFVSQLRNMSGDITVRINSKGGEVGNALAVYQQLREHKGKVTCVVDGYAYSCAAWIALAGEERYINTGGLMMVHNPSMYIEVDNENALENVMPQWRAHRDAINMIISERTGMTSEKVTELMNATTFLTSKDAVEMGFCNAVRSSSANLPTAIRNSVPEVIKNQLPEPVDCSDLAAKTLMLRSKILVN
jgi:ATP-dependent Clp protease protease subunit